MPRSLLVAGNSTAIVLAGSAKRIAASDAGPVSSAAGPGAIAGLAHVVQQAARAGDAVAVELVRTAGRDLADHVVTLLGRFPPEMVVPLALAGGILTPGNPVREELLALLTERAPRVSVANQAVDPPRGALTLAARLHAAQ